MTQKERIEKAVNLAYPDKIDKELATNLSEVERWEFLGEQADRRDGFRLGYKTGEKETIERGVKWFNEHFTFPGMAQQTFIEDFRKAMEE